MPGATDLDPLSPDHLRLALRAVPTSVAIITTTGDSGEPIGVSVGSFTSISLDPPLVGFFIARTSSTWPKIAATGGFCASILGSHQEDLCRLFATPGADRFGTASWAPNIAGRPVMDGAVAWFECDVDQVVPTGDHDLVLGRVTAMRAVEDASPLVFVGGSYGAVAPSTPGGSDWA